jgi:nitric oxide reductase activation protein
MDAPLGEVVDWASALAERCESHRCVLEGLAAGADDLPPALRAGGAWLRARPLSFFPDFDFPLEPQTAPAESLVIDQSSAAKRQRGEDAALAATARTAEKDRKSGGEEDEEAERDEEEAAARPVPAVYLYDEWNGLENDYYRDWCRLQELRPKPAAQGLPHDEDFRRRVGHVKKVFQRLRPDLVVKDKYLQHGDSIDIDSLVRFVTQRRARLSPRVRFWVKPRLNRRDVATALLLDVSGSTGREAGRADVIEVEKEAAHLLAAGLSELGDRFGLFGFTGNGREQCVFQVFKDFEESWDDAAEARLAAARPGSSTRIGVALRHAGRKLAELPVKTKLILLLTDGRPMDTDYDPRTRYAHSDVHKACEENAALGVHTFCIAVEPEEPEELDLMFARRRYAVLEDVENLPDVLTRSYLKLTRT